MSKPESWRLDVASYPNIKTLNTRFQDMDVNGHLNNVAFASLFENCRVQLNRGLSPIADRAGAGKPDSERVLVAVVTINYLREGSYPEDVIVGTGIGKIGNSSWTLVQGMFQHGQCIATCDTVVVCKTDGQSKPLRPELVTELETMLAKPA